MIKMKIPMPFPKCPNCNTGSKQSTHEDCNGLLEIEPYSQKVYCKECFSSWNLWDSEYHCTCGHIFYPKEIESTVTSMLDICKIAVEELYNREISIKQREDIYKSSFREFLCSFMGKMGNLAGIAVETLIRIFLH